MRIATAAVIVLLTMTACSQPPTRTGEVERARDIMEQLDTRNAEIGDRGSD